MRPIHIGILALVSTLVFTGCDNILDTRIDTDLTEDHIAQDYRVLWNFGYASYAEVRSGFSILDNNLFAAATDEAEQTISGADAQLFNEGSWNAYNNPDDYYADAFAGIRAANLFLEKSEDYRTFLALNRDTVSDHQLQYRRDVQDIERLRAEARVLRAYYYLELIKRYGGVPLVTKTLSLTENTHLPRNSVDEIVNFIVSEIDAVAGTLETDWKVFDVARDGRVTKGAALAVKSRALLYAASPLHNPSNDLSKWQAAARAALDVIELNQYTLDEDYSGLFLRQQAAISPEVIWSIRLGETNELERANYPIGTPGGASGVTPSHNLVSAYEYVGEPDPLDPYANRDPRLGYTIVTNNSEWNGRTIEIWQGGADDPAQTNASRTGYYLKKFLNPDLNLVEGESELRNWIIFRYAEILLNYAEAMNEAFGPDNDNGWGLTARQAVNQVRSRPGVEMPDVVAESQAEMRDKIKHERRIELAFEDHRYWDLIRWKDAEYVLNQPCLGVRATKNADDSTFTYTEVVVENRRFVAPKMYFYPIPQSEVAKSGGVIEQNQGW